MIRNNNYNMKSTDSVMIGKNVNSFFSTFKFINSVVSKVQGTGWCGDVRMDNPAVVSKVQGGVVM